MASTSYRVAVLPGDGIGPEVIAEAQATLELAARLGGFAVASRRSRPVALITWPPAGRWRRSFRSSSPRSTRSSPGPFGDPRVPDTVILWGTILALRQRFDQYVNLRPARLLPGVPSALRTLVDVGATSTSSSSARTPRASTRERADASTAAARPRSRSRRRSSPAPASSASIRYAFEYARARGRTAGDQRDQVQRPATRDAVLGRGHGRGRARVPRDRARERARSTRSRRAWSAIPPRSTWWLRATSSVTYSAT